MIIANKYVIYDIDLSKLNVELMADLAPDQYLVKIHFKNGEFVRCDYRFDSPYMRSHWHLLALIDAEITRLEEVEHGNRKNS